MRAFVFVVLSLVGSAAFAAEEDVATPKGWLLDAESDQARFEMLQGYLGGFSSAMREVGERYQSVHEALNRHNFELANYHWDKIRSSIENGYLKRPGRKANADAIFLNKTWGQVKSAFESKDVQKAWTGFEQAKQACITCHTAESVPYMNNQPLFDLSAPAISVE